MHSAPVIESKQEDLPPVPDIIAKELDSMQSPCDSAFYLFKYSAFLHVGVIFLDSQPSPFLWNQVRITV